MKTLYEASNAVEAHMLLDLLKQEGLSARIHGEHLQGAIGELPAAGLVRLVVDEADYAQARALVERWDASQPKEPTLQSPARSSRTLYAFVIGALLGIAGTYAVFRSPVTVEGIDHNRDGLLDEKWTYAPSGTVLKFEADRNVDRKLDYIGHYDRRGLVESAESDDDFDGVFETRARFRAGNAEMSETDTDGDGYPDLRTHFINGVLSSVEYLNPSTGLALRVEHLKLGKPTFAEVDTDKDGKLDTRRVFSPLGEVATTERLPGSILPAR